MSPQWRALTLIGAVLLAACSAPIGSSRPTEPPEASLIASGSPTPATSASPPAGGTPTPGKPTDPARTAGTPTPAATAPAATGTRVVLVEPWAVATLTDVSTGEGFRIADLVSEGKVVFVEPMAIWCSNCRAQQAVAVDAFEQLGPDVAEWVCVDVETSESAEALARYRDQYGFPFRYVIADTTLARGLVDQFGDVVLSPPSVNVIIVGTGGEITHLLGHHDAAELVALATEHAQ